MRRSFLPIGQGAFCWEQFFNHSAHSPEEDKRINVVYDCGSLSGIKLLHMQINRCFKRDEKIHAVFLSHFDEDHVNGLEYLLIHNKVEHIFFPLLTKEDKALIRLHHLVNSASADEHVFWLRFALDPFETLSQMNLKYIPILHPVMSEDRIDADVQFRDISESYYQQVHSGDNVFEIVRDSTKEIHSIHKLDWLYIPFHFREKTNRNLLKIILTETLGTCDPEKLLDLLKSNPSYRTTIKEAYNKIPGSFNSNCMTLFSGTKSEHPVGILDSFRCPCIKYHWWMKNGVLYTGDYDASGNQKWKQLQSAYEKYIPYIGCLQVPHHGSKHNFNLKLLDIESCRLYFISAGLKNKYKHPDGDVIKQIVLSNKCLGIVTEQPWSEISMIVVLCDYI